MAATISASAVRLLRGHALGGGARGHDLEALHHREDLVDRLARDRAHGGADVGDVVDEALRLQELQGLAHRDGAHLELARELVDHEPPAGRELAAHDRVAQRAVDELLLRAVTRTGVGKEPGARASASCQHAPGSSSAWPRLRRGRPGRADGLVGPAAQRLARADGGAELGDLVAVAEPRSTRPAAGPPPNRPPVGVGRVSDASSAGPPPLAVTSTAVALASSPSSKR